MAVGAHSAGAGDGVPPAPAGIRHIRATHASTGDRVAWFRAPAADHVPQRTVQRLPGEHRQEPGEEGRGGRGAHHVPTPTRG